MKWNESEVLRPDDCIRLDVFPKCLLHYTHVPETCDFVLGRVVLGGRRNKIWAGMFDDRCVCEEY